jgi:hypothetical protein
MDIGSEFDLSGHRPGSSVLQGIGAQSFTRYRFGGT